MHTEEAYWIGLSDIEKEGAFVWDSGHALSGQVAKHWSKGHPNNGGNEDCGTIWNRNGNSGISNGMNDMQCTNIRIGFVCQKPIGSRICCTGKGANC